jgi:hypothetical protein
MPAIRTQRNAPKTTECLQLKHNGMPAIKTQWNARNQNTNGMPAIKTQRNVRN